MVNHTSLKFTQSFKISLKHITSYCISEFLLMILVCLLCSFLSIVKHSYMHMLQLGFVKNFVSPI